MKKKSKKVNVGLQNTQRRIPLRKPRTILRYPRLDTILMVERTIKKYDGEFKKKALWEHLPRKVMYQTYSAIIDYLYGYKVSIDAEGKIGWMWYPKETKYWFSRTDLFVNFTKDGRIILENSKISQKNTDKH